MDFVLVFLSIISAALFQYVTALPYDVTDKNQVKTYTFLMHFSLKLLFLPLVVIVTMWLTMHILRNENWKMVLRRMVWDLASMAMALNVVSLFVFGISINWNVTSRTGFMDSLILVAIAFGLAFLLEFSVFKEYERASLADPRMPTYNFSFKSPWQYARILIPFVTAMIWFTVLWISVAFS
jgi:hypothetical protein